MSDETPGENGVPKVESIRSRVETRLDRTSYLLKMFNDTVDGLLREVEQDHSKAPEAEKHVKGLRSLLKALNDEERKFDDFKTERAGPAGEFALDLDAARAAIGERLSRLRRNQEPAEVSG